LLARWLASALLSFVPALPFPMDLRLGLDGRVVAFTTGLTLIAALASGLAPALRSSKADVVAALKDDAAGPLARTRLRSGFIVAQVACTVVLVATAGLF